MAIMCELLCNNILNTAIAKHSVTVISQSECAAGPESNSVSVADLEIVIHGAPGMLRLF